MRTHTDIIGDVKMQEKLLEITRADSIHTVRSWKQRKRIPPEHWPAIASAKLATLEELAAGLPPRVRPADQQAAA